MPKPLRPATVRGDKPKKQLQDRTSEFFSHISSNAKVLVVCKSPEVVDVKHQTPFTSKQGVRLLKSLGAIGYTQDDISLINIIPYALPTKWASIGFDELQVRKEILKREITRLDPTLIVALGDFPAKILTVADGASKYRGSVLACTLTNNHKVLVCFDQYDVHISPKNQYANSYDFARILPNISSKAIIRKTLDICIEENLDVFRHEFLNEEYLHNPDSWLSFDIECIGSDLVCIGFSKTPNDAWVMPLHDFNIRKFCEALRLIDRILRSPVRKVAQNGNFDIFYLGYYYKIKVENFYFDTMLAQHSLYSNTPKGLDFLASLYTNEPYWKDEGKQWKAKHINWKEFYEYNGKDSANTLEIALAQIPLLHSRNVVSTFKRSMGMCYPIVTMEMTGVRINKSIQQELSDENDEIYRKLELLLYALVGFELNIKSHKQVKEYLYGVLKLPKKYKDGKLTSGNDALLALISRGGPLIKIIIMMRDYAKRGTFFKVKTTDGGRVHTTFKIGGTETGRLSSSKSILGIGSNLQNIPKRARKLYIADLNKSMINADYSKAESWIVAHLANDDKMITALYGEDFHKVNASNILDKPVSEISFADRQLGKKISHACWVPGAEVLTPEGWRPIETISVGDTIAQWEPSNSNITFTTVTHMVDKEYSGDIYKFDGTSFTQQVTPDHRMYVELRNKRYKVISADELASRNSAGLPLFGKHKGNLDIEPTLLKLLIAIIADGYITPGGAITFNFKKKREFARLLELLSGYKYNIHNKSNNTYKIYIPRGEVESITAIIGKKKELGAWILSLTQAGLQILISEVLYWDGYTSKNGFRNEYFTTNYNNAVWIQTAAHLAGKQALLRVDDSCKEGRKLFYSVSFNNRVHARLQSMEVTKKHYSGRVYCPTVDSGAFMVRFNNRISVSGNCNYSVTAFTFHRVMIQEGHEVTRGYCQELLDKYFECYPRVRGFQASIREQLGVNMTLTNIFGRKMTYLDHWGDTLFRSAYAYVPQGSVGDMTNQGLKNIYDTLDVEILLQIHDAVLMQKETHLITDELVASIQEAMSFDINVNHHTFKIPVDIEVGPNWLDLVEYTEWKEQQHAK